MDKKRNGVGGIGNKDEIPSFGFIESIRGILLCWNITP